MILKDLVIYGDDWPQHRWCWIRYSVHDTNRETCLILLWDHWISIQTVMVYVRVETQTSDQSQEHVWPNLGLVKSQFHSHFFGLKIPVPVDEIMFFTPSPSEKMQSPKPMWAVKEKQSESQPIMTRLDIMMWFPVSLHWDDSFVWMCWFWSCFVLPS